MKLSSDFMKEVQNDFLEEVSCLLEQCEESYLRLENLEFREAELSKIFRLTHSLKGSGATFGFNDLASFAHAVEDCLSILRVKPDLITADLISLLLKTADAFKKRISVLKEGKDEPWDIASLKEEVLQVTQSLLQQSDLSQKEKDPSTDLRNEEMKESSRSSTSFVKIDPSRIDGVLDLVGELVVLKGQLLQTSASISNQRHVEILSLLDKTIRELQDKTLFMRLAKIKPLFLRVQRVIRDLSLQLSKQVEFSYSGDDIEVDRAMIELLSDPLVHLARNAVDHAIESPAVRMEAGKGAKATVSLSAKHASGRVIITLQDDGGGIDRDRVIKKAKDRGLLSKSIQAESLTDQEVYDFLFIPGFSTAERVTDVSGRGVGLDIVKTAVEKLKGSVQIESRKGMGTSFQIVLPLTTAITDGIIVMVQGCRFVVSMSSIIELVPIESKDIHDLTDSEQALLVRNRTIPLIKLRDVLASVGDLSEVREQEDYQKRSMVLVIHHCGEPMALLVDGVIGQSQVVVKALPQVISVKGLAGASILGDGRIALVLDVDALAKNVKMTGGRPQPFLEAQTCFGA